MPNIGPTELIIIGIIVVLLFGATRLPATAKGLGQALKLFKKEIRDDEDKPQTPEVTAQQQPTQVQPPVQVQQAPAQPSYQQAPQNGYDPQAYQQNPAPQAPVHQAPIQQVPVQQAPNQPQQDQPRSAVTPGNQG